MLLGLHKNLSFNSGTPWPYATGGDYVYLYEEGNKTYRVHEFLTAGATATLNVEVGGSMDVLVVAGGGAGGKGLDGGGGGGAGGLTSGILKTVKNDSLDIYVGLGGIGVTCPFVSGSMDGESSRISKNSSVLFETNGGGGGGWITGCLVNGSTVYYTSGGRNGGSGGGGRSLGQTSPGSGIAGQGYGGGTGNNQSYPYGAGGGGGGAGGEGESPGTTGPGGDGGIGIQWPENSGRYFAGGGAGRIHPNAAVGQGVGGLGGGGNPESSGSPNTGGGGGGSSDWTRNGGSGIVIVRYVVAEKKLWTPEDLGTSVIGWWDASDETTLFDSISGGTTPTDGSEVKRVEDKSSKGIHLYPWTAYNPNLYGPLRKVGYQNNLDCLEFSSSTVSRALVASNSPTSSSRFTIFSQFLNWMNNKDKLTIIAYYPVRANAIAQNVGYQVQQTFNIFSTSTSQITSGTRFGDRNGSAAFTNTGYVSNTGGIYCSYFDRNASPDYNYLRHNGTEISTVDLSSSSYTLTWEDGAGEGSRMGVSVDPNSVTTTSTHYESTSPVMGEIIYVNDGTLSNIQKLEGYIAHKWGLTNNLPAGHPYKYEPPYKVEPEEIVTDGLVLNLDAGDYASYPRSGTTWYDISGNGLNGTLTNGPTYDSANKGSIVTDGSDDYIVVGRIPYTSSGTQSVTWSLWTRPSSTSGNIMSMSSTSPQGGWNMPPISAGSGQRFIGKIWNNNQLFSSTYSLDTWYNLVLVWNYSATASERGQFFYVNGQLVDSQTNVSYSASNASGGNMHFLGQSNPGSNNTGMYSGRYGQFSVYNRALSSTEISQNFNALRGRYGI